MSLLDALWDINEKGRFIPNLAARVPTLENGGISEDGTVWKIELKKGVKWHDGKPFTAKDVEFTYKTIVNPKIAIRSRSGFDLISDFKILDDHNVEIHLSKPFVPFAWAWQKMYVVPEHILAKVPVKYGTGSNYVQYENPELDTLLDEGVLISNITTDLPL